MASLHNASSDSSGMFGKASTKSRRSGLLAGSAGIALQSPQCPECQSKKIWKQGLRYSPIGDTIQRWLCRNCGYRFSQPGVKFDISGQLVKMSKPGSDHLQERIVRVDGAGKKAEDPLSFGFGEDVRAHKVTVAGKVLNTFGNNSSYCQICAEGDAKNLAAELSQIEIPRRSEADTKGKLVEYTWYMEKQGYAQDTIRGNTGALKALIVRNADLMDSESVKKALAKEQKWSQNRRRNVINAYSLFLKINGLKWDKPRNHVDRKIPFIPMEKEIDDLIAGCSTRVATFLQTIKETAMRSGEAKRLKWIDVDFERKTITLNEPEKGSLPRICNNLSGKLFNMLNAMPHTSPYVFGDCTVNSLKATFLRARKRLGQKLQNPRLLAIHFHTLRHWRATMEYHNKPNIVHVQQWIGHKDVRNTMLYVQIDEKLFPGTNDNYITGIAHDVHEAEALVQVGFEYVAGNYDNGGMLFRKAK